MTQGVRTRTRVVDDRTFLKGLDELYRNAMQRHEAAELLACARAVCQVLSVAPAAGPVEGYYTESEELREYFQRMRALQGRSREERPRVAALAEFKRLEQVTGSPLFGKPGSGALLPASTDPLTRALTDVPMSQWTVPALTARARDVVRSNEDFSLVGLAAFAGDAVLLAALRETAVLYAGVVAGCAREPERIVYEWRVDPALAERARQFIEAFNALFTESLPTPGEAQAEDFWAAAADADHVGRCVRIGYDDRASPHRQYHWAIVRDANGEETVHEFWRDEIWTTERFREHRYAGRPLP